MSAHSPVAQEEAPSRPRVSIIIPTRNRCAILERCLAALPAGLQGLPAPEVIVADDCSTDETAKIMRQFRIQTGWQVHHVRQDRALGANAARNAALRLAQGEVVVFIDDDVLVSEGWLAKLLAGLSQDCPVVSGPVRLTVEGPVFGKHREEISAFFGEILESPVGFDGGQVPVLGNLAACRAVFERAGFDESLRPPVEETDWLRRSGVPCGFVADAFVWHYKTREELSARRVFPSVWRRGREDGWWVRERSKITTRECWTLAMRSAHTSLRAFGHSLLRGCWGGVVVGLGELSKALALAGLLNRRGRAPESWR